jgi:hypothetical protein
VQNNLEWLEAIDLDKSREHCKITSALIEGFPGIKSATRGAQVWEISMRKKRKKKKLPSLVNRLFHYERMNEFLHSLLIALVPLMVFVIP